MIKSSGQPIPKTCNTGFGTSGDVCLRHSLDPLAGRTPASLHGLIRDERVERSTGNRPRCVESVKQKKSRMLSCPVTHKLIEEGVRQAGRQDNIRDFNELDFDTGMMDSVFWFVNPCRQEQFPTSPT